MLLKSEIGRNTFLLTDKKGRNVFHYAVKYPDVLRVILKDNDLVGNQNRYDITPDKYFKILYLQDVYFMIKLKHQK